MGAWGSGSFENDGALDFAAEIAGPDDLLKPLRVENPDQKIDADLACEIIVIAECVAAMRGYPSDDIPSQLLAKLDTFGQPSRSLYLHTRDHLAAVLERSELLELWSEDDPSEFIEAIHELIGRLNKKAIYVKPTPRPQKTPFYEKAWFKEAPCCFCGKPMGSEEFASVDTKINDGTGSEIGLTAWAHLACLNRALHYKFRMRPFSMHAEDVGSGDAMFELLDAKPTLED